MISAKGVAFSYKKSTKVQGRSAPVPVEAYAPVKYFTCSDRNRQQTSGNLPPT